MRDANIELDDSGSDQSFAGRRQRRPGIEYVVNDDGPAPYLPDSIMMDNSAVSSLFFEPNDICRRRSRRRSDRFATSPGAFVWGDEARIREPMLLLAIPEFGCRRMGLERQWQELMVVFAVRIDRPYLF